MSNRYTADGRRISSMAHAKKGHQCGLCEVVAFGNGGEVSHGRAHVRRGEAVELVKYHEFGSPTRTFIAPNDPKVAEFLARGFESVAS